MAMSVVYATVHGRLVQESRGGVVTRYVSDTLGSVIKTTDAAGSVTSETTYWPFGEIRTQTGTNPSPWGFCGTLGYYKDAAARLYVRARILRADLSRWLSVDPLWPTYQAYTYCYGAPASCTDVSGRFPKGTNCGNKLNDFCKKLNDDLKKNRDKIKDCIGPTVPPGLVDQILDKMKDVCSEGGPAPCIVCGSKSLPEGCEYLCKSSTPGYSVGGITLLPVDKPLQIPIPEGATARCGKDNSAPIVPTKPPVRDQACGFIIRGTGQCDGVAVLCNPSSNNFFHELAHLLGIGGAPGHNDGKVDDIVYRIGNCLSKKW